MDKLHLPFYKSPVEATLLLSSINSDESFLKFLQNYPPSIVILFFSSSQKPPVQFQAIIPNHGCILVLIFFIKEISLLYMTETRSVFGIIDVTVTVTSCFEICYLPIHITSHPQTTHSHSPLPSFSPPIPQIPTPSNPFKNSSHPSPSFSLHLPYIPSNSKQRSNPNPISKYKSPPPHTSPRGGSIHIFNRQDISVGRWQQFTNPTYQPSISNPPPPPASQVIQFLAFYQGLKPTQHTYQNQKKKKK